MRFEAATVEIRPRSVTEIADLACLFYREHFAVIGGLAAALGLPVALLSVGLHVATGQAWVAALAFWLLLPLSGGAVVLAASRIVFGTAPTVRGALRLYRGLWGGLFLRRLGQGVAALALAPIVVGWALRLRWGFDPMIRLLERLTGPYVAIRGRGLYRRGGSRALALDLVAIAVAVAIALAAVSILDFALGDFVSLWPGSGLFYPEALDDPVRTGLWILAALAVSPIVHLCWFFYYLDARIRGEGWDLELGLKAAAGRIPSSAEEAA